MSTRAMGGRQRAGLILLLLAGAAPLASAVTCNPGSYYDAASACVTCTAGYKCAGGIDAAATRENCPAGKTSAEGPTTTCSNCPWGTYNTDGGACIACPLGSSCVNRAVTPVACVSTASYVEVSALNVESCSPCSDGDYETGGACVACVAGNRCFDGKMYPCADGYYSGASLADEHFCTPCPENYKCADKAGSPVGCATGTFSAPGQTVCDTCPGGQQCNLAGAPSNCAKGSASADAATECTNCASGYFAADEGATTCTICPPGSACSDATVDPVQCLKGTYAVGGQATCTQCPAGKSQEGLGATLLTNCVECPVGKECSDPMLPVDCPSGYYSGGGGAVVSCTQCAPGTSTVAIGAASGVGASSCSDCPAGYKCPNSDESPVACQPGEYSINGAGVYTGATECASCPEGHYCSGDSAIGPQACSAGTYAPLGAGVCTICPVGYSCLLESGVPTLRQCDSTNGLVSDSVSSSCVACPAGYMCAGPALEAIACPSGSYRLSTHDASICTPCAAGTECPDATVAGSACASGYYSLAGAASCTICPDGFQCADTKDAVPVPCSPGEYQVGSVANVGGFLPACAACSAGSECPQPHVAPKVCQDGSYALAGQQYCTLCAAGSACPNKDGTGIVTCAAGKYAEAGEMACHDCDAGSYCPYTSQRLVIPCNRGTHSAASATECTACPAGQISASDGQSCTDCSAGTFSLGSAWVCNKCPAGYECPDTSSDAKLPCGRGNYSGGGQAECTPCPAGQACPYTDKNVEDACPDGWYSLGRQAVCTPCPAGYFCSDAITFPTTECAPGSFALGGQKACEVCEKGHFCNTTIRGMTKCAPGYYSSSSGATDCTICPAGYKCADPTVDPVLCSEGDYSPAGVARCLPCEPGYQCLSTSVNNMSRPEWSRCREGHWCDGKDEHPCPEGTYNNDTTGAHQDEACRPCLAGFYCPASSSYGLACPTGHYCPQGTPGPPEAAGSADEASIGPIKCPAGSYQPDLGKTMLQDCLPCTAGYVCSAASSIATSLSCPEGYYCPSGTEDSSRYPCPHGTYSGANQRTTVTDCADCSIGYYCPQASIVMTPCPVGTWNPDGKAGFLRNCRSCTPGKACPQLNAAIPAADCAKGYYCPYGTAFPTDHPCPPGTFSDNTDNTNVENCAPCPAGKWCDWATTGAASNSPPQSCAAGHYCPIGAMSGTSSAHQYMCPPGTFSPNTNNGLASDCTNCTAGSYCVGGEATVTGTCSAGYMCPEGSYKSDQTPCTAGTSSTSGNALCSPCPQGTYCLAASPAPVPCPPGTYGFSGSVAACTPCQWGNFCPQGATVQSPCSAGTYAGIGFAVCLTCPVGQYCEAGPAGLPQPCAAGTMRQLVGASAASDCAPCSSGHYCPEGSGDPTPCPRGTMRASTGAASGLLCLPCTAGFFCVQGSAATSGDCEVGHKCPAGSHGPKQSPCPGGTYQDEKNEATCKACTAGGYCPPGSVSVTPCTPGYWCGPGVHKPVQCAMGTFSASTSLTAGEQCTACTAGEYCDGVGLTQPRGQCDAGYICAAGSYSPNPLTGACPIGGYCPVGSHESTACAQGTYNAITGARSQADCLKCPAGYFCDSSGTQQTCTSGHYCPEGSDQPLACPKLHFCPAGASQALVCAAGFDNQLEKQGSCVNCPAGYYCPGRQSAGTVDVTVLTCDSGNITTSSGLLTVPCPAGSYCPTGSSIPIQCPLGTFSSAEGLKTDGECSVCSPGYACTTNGLTISTAVECAAGFYCLNHSHTAEPFNVKCRSSDARAEAIDDEGLDVCSSICPRGHYCPAQTGYPTACPSGTYRGTKSGMVLSDCAHCTPGSHCDGTGLHAPVGLCSAGFYCGAGTRTATPVNDTDCLTGPCGPCEPGHYCPTGSITQVPCAAGTYQKNSSSPSCTPCAAEYYCPEGTADYEVYECPAGYFCPEGTSQAKALVNRCPKGTFKSITKGSAASACTLCSPGQYCATEGLTQPTGPCAPGHYCNRGSEHRDPGMPWATVSAEVGGLCPAGYYCPGNSSNLTGVAAAALECVAPFHCPQGSYQQVACPDGTYTDENRQPVCKPCPAGFACRLVDGNTEITTCPLGFYCVPGTGYALRDSYACPQGTYEPNRTCTSLSQFGCPGLTHPGNCSACPAGRYCLNGKVAGVCAAGAMCYFGCDTPFPEKGRSSGCTQCPPGHYCPEGTGAPATLAPSGSPLYLAEPAPCQGGKVNANHGAQRESQCTTCPEGHVCIKGQPVAMPCPVGHYCPLDSQLNTTSMHSCQPGTYSRLTGAAAIDSSACAECPSGYFCPQQELGVSLELDGNFIVIDSRPGVANYSEYPCAVGHYCPAGSVNQTECPIGTYRNTTEGGRCGVKDCTPCEGGKKCAIATVTPVECPAGTYCPPGFSSTKLGEDACPAEHIPGSQLETDCPLGSFCPPASEDHVYCPPGTFCGKKSHTPALCPHDSYCPQNLTCDSLGGKGSCYALDPAMTFALEGTEPLWHTEQGVCSASSPSTCYSTFNITRLASGQRVLAAPDGSQWYLAGSARPVQCPLGTHSPNNTLERDLEHHACLPCPPGTAGDDPTRLTCRACDPGHYCTGCTTTTSPGHNDSLTYQGQQTCPWPALENLGGAQRGGDCKAGTYCPLGSSRQTPCPTGTFNNITTRWNESQCSKCLTDSYNDLEGQKNCFPCGSSSFALPGSTICSCAGANRAFQKTDRKCICEPGFEFFGENMKMSEDDSAIDCQPVFYERCGSDQNRDPKGKCVSTDGSTCETYCLSKKGTFVPSLGICDCEDLDDEEDVCNKDCRKKQSTVQFIDGKFAIVKEGSIVETYDIPDSYEDLSCETADGPCNMQILASTQSGPKGVYDPEPAYFAKLLANLAADNSSSLTARDTGVALLQSGRSRSSHKHGNTRLLAEAGEPKGVLQPVLCLLQGEVLVFDVSGGANRYPVYVKDSLYNTNPKFDYSAFRKLAEAKKSNSSSVEDITIFPFKFVTAGVYTFAENDKPDVLTVIRVMEKGKQCPFASQDDNKRIVPMSSSSMVSLGVKREARIMLVPNWWLIFGLLCTMAAMIVGVICGMNFLKRSGWVRGATGMPNYRKMGARFDFDEIKSKGTRSMAVHGGGSRGGALNRSASMDLEAGNDAVASVGSASGSGSGRGLSTHAHDQLQLQIVQLADHMEVTTGGGSASGMGMGRGFVATDGGILSSDLTAHAGEVSADWDNPVDLQGFSVTSLYDRMHEQTFFLSVQLARQRAEMHEMLERYLRPEGEDEADAKVSAVIAGAKANANNLEDRKGGGSAQKDTINRIRIKHEQENKKLKNFVAKEEGDELKNIADEINELETTLLADAQRVHDEAEANRDGCPTEKEKQKLLKEFHDRKRHIADVCESEKANQEERLATKMKARQRKRQEGLRRQQANEIRHGELHGDALQAEQLKTVELLNEEVAEDLKNAESHITELTEAVKINLAAKIRADVEKSGLTDELKKEAFLQLEADQVKLATVVDSQRVKQEADRVEKMKLRGQRKKDKLTRELMEQNAETRSFAAQQKGTIAEANTSEELEKQQLELLDQEKTRLEQEGTMELEQLRQAMEDQKQAQLNEERDNLQQELRSAKDENTRARLVAENKEAEEAMSETMDKEKERQEQALKDKMQSRQHKKLNKLRREQNDELNTKKLEEDKPVDLLGLDQTTSKNKESAGQKDAVGVQAHAEAGKAAEQLEEAQADAETEMAAKVEELRAKMEMKRTAALAEEGRKLDELMSAVDPEDKQKREELKKQHAADMLRLQSTFDGEKTRQELEMKAKIEARNAKKQQKLKAKLDGDQAIAAEKDKLMAKMKDDREVAEKEIDAAVTVEVEEDSKIAEQKAEEASRQEQKVKDDLVQKRKANEAKAATQDEREQIIREYDEQEMRATVIADNARQEAQNILETKKRERKQNKINALKKEQEKQLASEMQALEARTAQEKADKAAQGGGEAEDDVELSEKAKEVLEDKKAAIASGLKIAQAALKAKQKKAQSNLDKQQKDVMDKLTAEIKAEMDQHEAQQAQVTQMQSREKSRMDADLQRKRQKRARRKEVEELERKQREDRRSLDEAQRLQEEETSKKKRAELEQATLNALNEALSVEDAQNAAQFLLREKQDEEETDMRAQLALETAAKIKELSNAEYVNYEKKKAEWEKSGADEKQLAELKMLFDEHVAKITADVEQATSVQQAEEFAKLRAQADAAIIKKHQELVEYKVMLEQKKKAQMKAMMAERLAEEERQKNELEAEITKLKAQADAEDWKAELEIKRMEKEKEKLGKMVEIEEKNAEAKGQAINDTFSTFEEEERKKAEFSANAKNAQQEKIKAKKEAMMAKRAAKGGEKKEKKAKKGKEADADAAPPQDAPDETGDAPAPESVEVIAAPVADTSAIDAPAAIPDAGKIVVASSAGSMSKQEMVKLNTQLKDIEHLIKQLVEAQ